MKMTMIQAIEEYQCSGCVNGPNPKKCPKYQCYEESPGCKNHHAGTIGIPEGPIALGLPKGFTRFGESKDLNIQIWPSYEVMVKTFPNYETMYSIPIWCHLDKEGNTIVRWYSPRINHGWSTVILGDCRDQLIGAKEITEEHLAEMD